MKLTLGLKWTSKKKYSTSKNVTLYGKAYINCFISATKVAGGKKQLLL